MKLQVGDVVRLKSGERLMTVSHVGSNEKTITCLYDTAARVEEQQFSASVLEKVDVSDVLWRGERTRPPAMD